MYEKDDLVAKQHSKLNFIFVCRIVKLVKILFQPGTDSVWIWYLLMLVISGLSEVLVYFSGLAISQFYLVLNNKDENGFRMLLLKTTAIYISIAFAKSLLRWISGMFSLYSRKRLTTYLQSQYVVPKTLFDMTHSPDLDNPDQRITQDIERFTESIRVVLEQLIIDPFLIGYYTFQVAHINQLSPALMYVYFIVSCIMCKLAANPIVPLIFKRERLEGDFRFWYVRLRENVDGISLLKGEFFESLKLNEIFDQLLQVQTRVLWLSVPLKFFSEFFNYFGSSLCYILIAIPIFSGSMDGLPSAELSSLISQNSFLSMYLIYRFTMITNLADVFSELCGYTNRLSHFLELLELQKLNEVNRNLDEVVLDGSGLMLDELFHKVSPESIQIFELTIKCPSESRSLIASYLVQDLTLVLNKGEHLLIRGPNGSGKTTLLKVLFGLLPANHGKFYVPKFPHTMFIPQKPYLPYTATIEEVLGYGCMCHGFVEHTIMQCKGFKEFPSTKIKQALDKVGLGHLVIGEDGYFHPFPLYQLSPGECQRLHLARLLLWKPIWVFLDEGFSGIDPNGKESLVRLLIEEDISIVLVTHDAAPTFGKWKLLNIEQRQWQLS